MTPDIPPAITTARRRARLHALAAAVLALQACGGGGDDAAAASPAPAPSGATTAAPPSAAPVASPAPEPGPATAPTPPPASADVGCGMDNFEATVMAAINQYRAAGASCGTRGVFAPAVALRSQSQLVTAAYGHSTDMADQNYFSHTSLDGRTFGQRISAAGYAWSTVGENIAAGYGSVASVMAGWMASDGHCANLMNPAFTEVGVACARNDASTYRVYWSMELGRPR